MAEKIAIIGAGISGLCSALALQMKGFQVTVYEREEYHAAQGPGLILGRNALLALEALGIGTSIYQAGNAGEDFTIYSERGQPIANIHSKQRSKMAPFLFIRFESFFKILRNAIHPETIIYGKELVDFEEGVNGVQIRFKDGSEESADYLLACDGKDSLVRARLFPGSEPQSTGYTVCGGILNGEKISACAIAKHGG